MGSNIQLITATMVYELTIAFNGRMVINLFCNYGLNSGPQLNKLRFCHNTKILKGETLKFHGAAKGGHHTAGTCDFAGHDGGAPAGIRADALTHNLGTRRIITIHNTRNNENKDRHYAR